MLRPITHRFRVGGSPLLSRGIKGFNIVVKQLKTRSNILDRGIIAWLLAGCLGIAPAGAAEAPGPVLAQASVAADYLIGPGDSLQVFVWRNPDLTVTVPVRPDGKISTPLVEDMVAVGKTPSILARDIEKALAEYVKSPQVNVIVTMPASVFSQVKVIGQVVHPQSLAYRDGMTVLDAVLSVGGLGPYAAGNRAHLVRKVDGKEQDIKIKLESLVNNGDMKQNLPLSPGDVLVVPESRF
jgi:polysaccharide export outer membrane protein